MPTYLARSIVSPHGKNIADGLKTIEVRSWRPLQFPLFDLLIVENDIFLKQDGEIDPNGRAIALVDVLDVHEWQPSEVEQACSSGWLSDYWAWQLSNVRVINHPLSVCAERKLYSVELDVEPLISKSV